MGTASAADRAPAKAGKGNCADTAVTRGEACRFFHRFFLHLTGSPAVPRRHGKHQTLLR